MALKFLRSLDESCTKYETTIAGYIDGYQFGDRLLEGVMFRVEVDQSGSNLCASVDQNSASYFSGLNESKWLSEAVKYARGRDVFHSTADGEDDDIVLWDTEKSFLDQSFRVCDTLEIDGQPYATGIVS